MKDKIVKAVIKKYKKRSKDGFKKYGTTLCQNNKDNFLIHLQEELMDAVNYIQKELDNHKKIQELEERNKQIFNILTNEQKLQLINKKQ